MISFELVHIKWIDSEMMNEWVDVATLNKTFSEIHSIGLLIDQNEQGYILAGSYDPENNSINAVQFIPRQCVSKINPLSLLKVLVDHG
jgi:hypothetical protein